MDAKKKQYVLNALSKYWLKNSDVILHLPIPSVQLLTKEELPPKLIKIALPNWANSIGVNGSLLIPRFACKNFFNPVWNEVDWLAAIFWFMTGRAEQAYEVIHGPIHSYSVKLADWDPLMWEYAWVNRIALFLRKWSARNKDISEDELFGVLLPAVVYMTHDVDAVKKTLAIRIKQSIFNMFKLSKSLINNNFKQALNNLMQALRFTFSFENYWFFDKILNIEECFNIKSTFNFYAGIKGSKFNFKTRLFDPGYNVFDPLVIEQMKSLVNKGHAIGLHQSFDAWQNADVIYQEKLRLEEAAGIKITSCRQHWLRFSWRDTWKSQQDAGFHCDSTLGFNDRPGFRNSAALAFHQWEEDNQNTMHIKAYPMVFMDSHFYDYASLNLVDVNLKINHWLQELNKVSGEATVIWHQQVMGKDYGWFDGFCYCLQQLTLNQNAGEILE